MFCILYKTRGCLSLRLVAGLACSRESHSLLSFIHKSATRFVLDIPLKANHVLNRFLNDIFIFAPSQSLSHCSGKADATMPEIPALVIKGSK